MAKHFVLSSFIHTLQQGIAGFDSYPERHQAAMAGLIWVAGSKRRTHCGMEGHTFISQKEIRSKFGKNGFARMNNELRIFDVSPNWSIENGETKSYQLTEKVKIIKHKYLYPQENHDTKVLYTGASGKFKLLKTLLNPIAARVDDDPAAVSASGWRGAKILNKTPVCIPTLMFLYKCLSDKLDAAQDEPGLFDELELVTIARRIDATSKLIKWAQTDVGRPWLYHDQVRREQHGQIVRQRIVTSNSAKDRERCSASRII